MPKGYLYADIEVTDAAEFEKYRQRVPATIAAYGGRYLVRGGDPEIIEGAPNNRRCVILEFESRERLLEWYHSPEYKDVKAIRLRSSLTDAVVMTGYEGTAA
ncbi:MAG: DUF1330 domain-containing protein [Rhodopila sp.]|jgi:uncharacterized protein (DUF1330 family)